MPLRSSRFICLAILSVLACPLSVAQEKDEAELVAPRISNHPAAIVMGRVITHGEIEKVLPSFMEQNPDVHPDLLYWKIRQQLGLRALLVETAKLYMTNLTDEYIVRYFTIIRELDEKVVKENIKELREELLIRQYIQARMGIVDVEGVSPDYANFMKPTPQELKSYYNQKYKTNEPRPTRIRLAQFLFPKASFHDPERLKLAVDQCRKILSDPSARPKNLGNLSGNWEGCTYLTNEIDLGGETSLRKEIMDFVKIAEKGDVSHPIDLESGFVVAFIKERFQESIPTFAECQQELHDDLIFRKENFVRERILLELIERADYWPPDLFVPHAPEEAVAGKNPKSPPEGIK